MRRFLFASLALAFGGVAAAPAAAASASGDPARGAAVYQDYCGACHSLDANRVGPRHRGVFGRKAGSVTDFHYSAALKTSGIVWNAQTLDRWLINPQALVPGTAMGFRLGDPVKRADVIAYLKQQSTPKR